MAGFILLAAAAVSIHYDPLYSLAQSVELIWLVTKTEIIVDVRNHVRKPQHCIKRSFQITKLEILDKYCLTNRPNQLLPQIGQITLELKKNTFKEE